MYGIVLIAHGTWRWVVIAAGLAVLLSAARGWSRDAPWSGGASTFARLFGIAVDIQFLMGAALYLVLSPLTNEAMSAGVDAPVGSDLHFFGIIHGIVMSVAFIGVHLSSVLVRRGLTDAARYRRAILCYGLTLVVILGGIPWSRPLLRW